MSSAGAVAVLARPFTRGSVPAAHRGAIVAVVATLLGTVAPAAGAAEEQAPVEHAPDPALEARQQYEAGMQAYEARRFVEAALHFEAAVVQRPHAVALYTAALAWEQANRPDRAADDFVRALDVAGLSAPQAQNARDRLASLETAMGTLEVHAPEGWRVQLDANTEVFAPAHLHAVPGVHFLAIQAPSRAVRHRDVTLELGKTTRVELTETSVSPPASPASDAKLPPVEPSGPAVTGSAVQLRREIGFGLAGAGVASLAAGAILGVNALSARDAYNAAPTQVAYDHATSLQTWTNVAFLAGGVFVAAGVTLALWPAPRTRERGVTVSVAPSLGGAVVWGVF